MFKKLLVVVAISLCLSGCWWARELFLDVKLSETPFAPGEYGSFDRNVGTQTYVLTLNSSGSYDVDHDSSKRLILNRFKGSGESRVFIYAYNHNGSWNYGFLKAEKDGISEFGPSCIRKSDSNLAVEFGAKFDSHNSCEFLTKGSFHKAMLKYYELKGDEGNRFYRRS